MPKANKKASKEETILLEVFQLAHYCEFDSGHSNQVTRVALLLFDQLKDLHNLNKEKRFWLQCAAILHDIGAAQGWKGHHKKAIDVILSTKILSLDNRTRLIIGSIVRYHRKALPSINHDHYAALEKSDREIVDKLAAILRLADGLCRMYRSLKLDISCKITPKKIVINCIVPGPLPTKKRRIPEKGDLLQTVYKRELDVIWKSG